MTDEDRYADALHAAEREWAKRGLRPPLGTFWPSQPFRRAPTERRERVEELVRAGMRPSQIAAELGISRPGVSWMLRKIREEAQG